MKKIILILLVLLTTIASAHAGIDEREVYGAITYGWDNQRASEQSVGFEFGSRNALCKNFLFGVELAVSEKPDVIVEEFNWDPALETGRYIERDRGGELYTTLKVGYSMGPITVLGGLGFSGYQEEVYTVDANGPFLTIDSDCDYHLRGAAYGGAQIKIWKALITGGYDTRRGPSLGVGAFF